MSRLYTHTKRVKPTILTTIQPQGDILVIWYALTGTSFCIFLLSLFFYLRARKNEAQPVTQQQDLASAPFFTRRPRQARHTIGILTPVPNSSAFHLKTGLIQQLETSPHASYTIRLFHGSNDRVQLFNQAVTALKECDVVVPFGLACTNIAYEAARHHEQTTPVIFSGIKSHHIPLLRRQNTKEKLIGVISQRDSFTQINQLRALKPHMKNVLVLYRQQLEWLVSEVDEVCRYLHARDIGATSHLLSHGNHIDNQLGTIKQPFDTILLMPRTLNAKALQEMVVYCNIRGVTLCANELDAVTLGAAVGFGGEEVTIGTRVGRMVRDILEAHKQQEEDTIIEHIDHYQVFLNQRNLKQQGIQLSPELLFLLNQGEVTHDKLIPSEVIPPTSSLRPPNTQGARGIPRVLHPWGGL